MSQRERRPGLGEIIELEIESLDDAARGVGWADRELETHVPGALPGERVRAEVEFVDRHRRRYGRLLTVLERSPERAQPGCPHFGPCPGCELLHLSFAGQYAWKRRTLADALELDEARVEAVVPSPRPFGWRSRVRLAVSDDGTIGVRAPKGEAVLDMHGCLIHAPEVERIADAVRSLVERAREPITGLTGLEITASLDEGRALVTLEARAGAAGVDTLARVLAMRSDVAQLSLVTRDATDAVSDKGPLVEVLAGARHRLSAGGLGPANPGAVAAVGAELVARLEPAGARVLDLYAGIGSLTLALAKAGAREVVAVEAHAGALADAHAALALEPGLTAAVRLVEGSVEDELHGLVDGGERFDAVVLDPPKKGASREALEQVRALAPARLAYLGRDPRVVARDLRGLLDGDDYELRSVVPFDVAPHTRELEVLLVLGRRGG